MGSVVDLQRWLYAEAVAALNGLAASGLAGAPTLVASAFGFGLLHALLPGHGKAVMASRFAGAGGAFEAIATTSVLILVHVGSAIIIAWGGFALITRTIGGAGRAPVLEAASQAMIVAIGLWLLWCAVRRHDHDHGEGRSFALAAAAGLVPCPLTFFIMSYAIPRALAGAGLLLAACFGAGMIVTVASVPLLAVVLRTRLAPWLVRSQVWRGRLAQLLATGAALSVVFLGAWGALKR